MWKVKQKQKTNWWKKRWGLWLPEVENWESGENSQRADVSSYKTKTSWEWNVQDDWCSGNLSREKTKSSHHNKFFFPSSLFLKFYLFEEMDVRWAYCNHFTICANQTIRQHTLNLHMSQLFLNKTGERKKILHCSDLHFQTLFTQRLQWIRSSEEDQKQTYFPNFCFRK